MSVYQSDQNGMEFTIAMDELDAAKVRLAGRFAKRILHADSELEVNAMVDEFVERYEAISKAVQCLHSADFEYSSQVKWAAENAEEVAV